jgi:hypothetical protein
MIKVFCAVAVLSLAATPCLAAQAAVYDSLTMAQLASVLTNELGVPAELQSADGRETLYVDGQAYQLPMKIQLSGILCNTAAPPSCAAIALLGVFPVPAGSVSDAQLLALASAFDFVTVDRLDATRLTASMAVILQGGVTADNIDNNLGFFAGQLVHIKAEIQKFLPSAPTKGKGT